MINKKQISILDCTLRDGGFLLEDAMLNGIEHPVFNKRESKKFINTMQNSNVDIIEIGSIEITDSDKSSFSIYQNIEQISKLIPKNNLIKIIKVPGVFEIPITISKNIKKYDAFLALGCVIKGKTPHFDFISQATTNAIMDLSIINKKPIGNGIITCLNMAQAKIRKKKGAEAAKAVNSVLSQK